jgi:hypothetical protein
MNNGLTEEGKKRLGRFVKEAYRNRDMSQLEFATWLTEITGIEVGESQVRTLVDGNWKYSLHFNVLFALDQSEALKSPETGASYSFGDIADILRGRLDPFTGKALQEQVK